ncbi:uncharacterized protein LOC107515747 [Rousettus aegyptiacus]|uniref:uncharacterized protein LOC107515747 n=1 Tax=Rousettus aegyptiacus TaxID=9407 RepID=UPI00168D71C8|nr:uncharacterized protein LOC107515747 [Rousettus aegyptiacus]
MHANPNVGEAAIQTRSPAVPEGTKPVGARVRPWRGRLPGALPVACEFSQAPQSLPPLKSLSAQLGVLASRGPRRRTLDTCSTQVRVAEIGIRPKIKAVQLKHKSEQKKVGGLRAVIKWSLGRGPWKEGRRPLRTCCCKRNTTQPKIRHPGRSLSEGFYHSSRISNTTHLTKNISPPYLPLRPVGQASAPAAGVFITGWTPRLLIGWLVRKMPQDMNVNVQFLQIH